MAVSKSTKRICPNGHTYYKSSDCPVCPICEHDRKPTDGFLAGIGAPARRALENEGLLTLEQISGRTEKELLSLHGVGKSVIVRLREVLRAQGLDFAKDK